MSPARHPDVQKLQDVFRDARLQCWQWLVGPEVPAENNLSEREVRPLAAARKSSHGSQSDRGAATRGVFMSILHTLKACGADPAALVAAVVGPPRRGGRGTTVSAGG